jgi:hypothetical protein
MLKRKRFLVPVLLLVFSLLAPAFVNAAQLSQAAVRLDRLGISDTGGMGVSFKLPNSVGAGGKIQVCFPPAFTITAGALTASTATLPNTPAVTPMPATLTATGAASGGACGGGTITITSSGTMSTGTLYGVAVTGTPIQNPSSGGTSYSLTVTSQNSGGTNFDSTTLTEFITSTSTGDQVGVTASVAATFSFNLGATADTITGIDDTAIKTSGGVIMTVSTNAPLGYTAYVRSSGGNLHSPTSGGTIPTGTFDGTPDALTAGGATSEYGFVPTNSLVCNTSCGGTLTYDPEYNIVDGSHAGAFNTTNFASFVSRSGYTVSDAIKLQERVAINKSIPPASDYGDTLTIVAAGNF